MTRSYAELFREARSAVREVTPRQADALRNDPATLFVDVREADEWEQGHIPGAVLVPKSHLELEIETKAADHVRPLVLYCAAGIRSVFAARTLQEMGYVAVVSMSGGFDDWKALGLPSVRPAGLTAEQQRRYSRHLLMPEVGIEGQATLLRSKVLLVGAGGLGSPAALYLAAAGVGTIGIVDFDVVDISNLQRQVLHSTGRLGLKKVVSAEVTIRALNPDVTVVAHDEVLGPANVDRLIAGYDVVVDGTDTFETRYTLNDAAVMAGIPVVHASVFRFEGQLTTFIPYEGPCYRCLHPVPPPPELAPGCSVTGVLGVVPGIMGLLQATEALKILLGIGETLAGRLVLFDALDLTFTELRLRRDPTCPVCSDAAVEARAAGRPLPIPGAAPGPASGMPAGGASAEVPAGPDAPADGPGSEPARPGPARATLPLEIRSAIVAHARAEYPNEACGLIAGTAAAAAGGSPTRWHATRNRSASSLRYEIEPDDLVRVVLEMDDAGEEIWAIVHSHVRSPARPSPTDVSLASYPDALHLLVSLSGTEADPVTRAESVRAWRIVDGQVLEVGLDFA